MDVLPDVPRPKSGLGVIPDRPGRSLDSILDKFTQELQGFPARGITDPEAEIRKLDQEIEKERLRDVRRSRMELSEIRTRNEIEKEKIKSNRLEERKKAGLKLENLDDVVNALVVEIGNVTHFNTSILMALRPLIDLRLKTKLQVEREGYVGTLSVLLKPGFEREIQKTLGSIRIDDPTVASLIPDIVMIRLFALGYIYLQETEE